MTISKRRSLKFAVILLAFVGAALAAESVRLVSLEMAGEKPIEIAAPNTVNSAPNLLRQLRDPRHAGEQRLTQSGFNIDSFVIAGGGDTSINGSVKVEGTIAEATDTDTLTGGSYKLEGGFWNTLDGVAAQPTPSPTGCSVLNFAAAKNFDAGTGPASVAAGDFNGDGKQDIVAVNSGSNNVSVFLANGTNVFTAATNYGVGVNPQAVAVGDLNGDGKLDLAVGNYNSTNVSILLGNGDGTFGAATPFDVGGNSAAVAIGDFNGDHVPDLAVSRWNSHTVSVLLGNGDGTFAEANFFQVGSDPASIAVGDFNNDGNLDIVTANNASDNVSILLGTGTGDFDRAHNFGIAGSEVLSVAVGDFNGDGKQDVATANRSSATVSVLLGDGAGGLGTATTFPAGFGPASVVVGDFNGDGSTDLATANIGGDDVSVLVGNGDGTFRTPVDFGAGSRPYSIAVGDFDGDGLQDLATANNDSNDISVLLRQCPLPPTLGNYANGSVPLGEDTNLTPSAAPTGTTRINVSTPTGFKGKLEADPATGIIRVTNAQPAGAYTVTVTAFNSGGAFVTKTFTLAVTTPSVCNSVGFGAATQYEIGGGPASSAVGDFNGDGKQDLAIADRSFSRVTILRGDGTGGFSAGANFNVQDDPESIAIGDFNGDGKQDLAVANEGAGNVSVLLGNGAGGFGTETGYFVGSQPHSVAVADFNHDGNLDIVTADGGSNTVTILFGDGQGGFANATAHDVGQLPISVAVGDFNGDGNPDVVTVNHDSGDVSVLLGNGAGGLSAANTFGRLSGPESVVVGDLDGDNRQDLAVADDSNNVVVFIGNGSGGFRAPANFPLAATPLSIAIGDFNSDGTQDLVTTNSSNSRNVSILLGDGAGAFGAAVNFTASDNPAFGVAVGDFNGDHRQDIVTANKESDNVSVLLSACPAPLTTPTITFGAAPTPTFPGGNFTVSATTTNNDSAALTYSVVSGPCTLVSGSTFTPTGAGTCVVQASGAATPHFGAASSTQNIIISSAACVAVSAPSGMTALHNSTLTVPLPTTDTTGKGIIAFDFALDYNSAVLTPLATPFDQTGTLSSGMTITTNGAPGHLVISGFGTVPLTGPGDLLRLKFNVVGSAPASSNLTISSFVFNEGTPCVTTANGSVTVTNGSIAGTVTYGNSTGTPITVPNVLLSAAGTPNVNVSSDAGGLYSLTGLGSGSYTVTPSKAFEITGITAFDAATVARYVVGQIPLTANQQIAADVSTHSGITSFDAALIAQTAAGIANSGIAGTWKFLPASRTYPNTATPQPNQDYTAILMGDVTGSWPSAARVTALSQMSVLDAAAAIPLSLPDQSSGRGTNVTVPIMVGDLTGQSVYSYDLDIAFDPAVLQPQVLAANANGSLSSALTIAVNSGIPGHLRVAAFGAAPLTGSGKLLDLNFTVVGNTGATTSITWQASELNEGNPAVGVVNGRFSVAAPTAGVVSVGGRVLTADGRGLRNAAVSMTNSSGVTMTTVTGAFGDYRFDDVQTGDAYVIAVTSKRYRFVPRVLVVTDELTGVDFIGDE